MTNILFITPDYPPLNSSGTHRSLKFTKKLRKNGINPIVITGNFTGVYDEKLNNEIPVDLIIYRIKTEKQLKNKNSYFSVNDNYDRRWRDDLNKQLPLIISKHKPLLIYLTCPPYSTALNISKFARRYKLPLLLDLRDAWSQWFLAPYPSILHYLFVKYLENKIFKAACGIIFPTDQLVLNYKKLYPQYSNKINLITNSIEEENYSTYLMNSENKNISIGYVGNFYYNPYSQKLLNSKWYKKKIYQWFHYVPIKEDWKYRSPFFFFKSIKAFIEKHPEFEQKLKIEFIGRKPKWFNGMVDDFNLNSIVKHHGFLSKDDSIKFQKKCDYLLSTSVKVENGEDYCIAGKTYEYLAMKKPIIGFVHKGAQQRILEKSGLGIMFNPDNTNENINIFYKLFTNKFILKEKPDFLDEYSSSYTTQQLSRIIKDCIKNEV